MKTKPFSGTVEEYAGQKLATPITFEGVADQYENVAELKASEDYPSDSEILKIVNTKKVTSAKAGAYAKATSELKTQYEASPAYLRANFIKAAVAAGMSTAQAEGMADSVIK